jgi:hypothetical protein
VYRFFVRKPEGMRTLGGPICRCVDNIMIDLMEKIEWCGLDRSGSG